jgi:transposase-like protein
MIDSSANQEVRRERCPTCGASTIVRKDGKFRQHRRIQKGRFLTVPCESSDTPAGGPS